MPTTLTPRMESGSSHNPHFLTARLAWHACTPREVAKAGHWHDGSPGWRAWVEHLAAREEPEPIACFATRRSPLTWAMPDDVRDSDTAELIASLHRPPKRNGRELLVAQLRAWLAESEGAAANVHHALACLALCHALPRLARVVPADDWWALLGQLVETAEVAAAINLNAHPLSHQLMAGELPLTLTWLFPEIRPCRNLLKAARDQLSDGLEVLLDGEGLPHRDYLRSFRPLLACWTRCKAMGDAIKGGGWDRKAERQYGWAVRQALRCTRYDGGAVLCDDAASVWDAPLFHAALQYDDDAEDDRIAALALPGGSGGSGKRLPASPENSEWADLAILRPSWERTSPILAVDYGARSLEVELSCGPTVLLSGSWMPRIRFDGQDLQPQADWECVCWESDEDMDYLELEMDMPSGLRVQRQMMLAREDLILYVADAVMANERPGQLDYAVNVPLADGVSFQGQEETREGFLVAGKRRALVMPLALDEWKADPRGGSFTEGESGLELRLKGQGRGLYAPLFFDLSPRRFKGQLTWRRLTVAQDRQIMPPGVAAAYRVQVGREQWVAYRSLTGQASRTFLGLNVYNEFVLGRFDRSGEMEPLIEIE